MGFLRGGKLNAESFQFLSNAYVEIVDMVRILINMTICHSAGIGLSELYTKTDYCKIEGGTLSLLTLMEAAFGGEYRQIFEYIIF